MPIRWHVCGIILCRAIGALTGLGVATLFNDWLEQHEMGGPWLGIAAAVVGFVLPAALFRRFVPFRCGICGLLTYNKSNLPFTGPQKTRDYLCTRCESTRCFDWKEAMPISSKE